jgi:hypothetical protein
MKRLLAVFLLLTMLAVSCGQASQSPGITSVNSNLGSMLTTIPDEPESSNLVWFSDMERIKKLAGVEPDIDANGFLQLLRATTDRAESQRLVDLMAGYTLSEFSGGKFLQSWKDVFGYDAFAMDQEITVQKVGQSSAVQPLFSVMKGNFAKNNIIEKLNRYGYQLKNYASIDYYSIRGDGQTGDLKSSGEARIAMAFLNRMLVDEQEIIAAPADDVFFPVLDVSLGKRSSLEGSLTYSRVAESLGNILGAALVPQSQLRSENVGSDWGKLHMYDLAGIGYSVEGQDQKVVIVLHYSDKSAADDIDELNRRMAKYMVTTGGLKNTLLSALFDIGDPKVTVYEPDSILKVELVYKSDTRETMWSDLVEAHDLGFLVSNP